MKKQLHIDEITNDVYLTRRKGTRNLKIALKGDGTVQLSVPYGLPEAFALKYLRSKAGWVNEHVQQPHIILGGAHIGKSHQLQVEAANITRPSTKISDTTIRVRLPSGTDEQGSEAQKTIKRACDKALLQQAKRLIPQRVEHLTSSKKRPYKSITIKKLTSRWGSCDSNNNLVFNSYLIQYDWKLIDYVICHEIAHTVHHDHSAAFWSLVEKMLPDYKERRAELKDMPTNVINT